MHRSTSTTKISSGKPASDWVFATIRIATGADKVVAAAIAIRSRGDGEPPDAAVDPEHDEEHIADAEQHRQGREKDRALHVGALAVDEEQVRDEK